MDCSPPGSSVLARILEWVAISCSRGSSWPRDWNHVSVAPVLESGFFTIPTWEVLSYFNTLPRQHWLIILIAGILLFFCYYYKWSIVLLFKLLYVIRFWEILYLSNFIKYFLFYLAIFWNDYVFYEMCCLHLILVNSYVFSPLLIDTLEYIERLFWLKLFTHFSK